MASEATAPITYRLELGGQSIVLNDFLGKPVRLEYLQQIECIHCGRLTSKSFNQGFCYPCFRDLAQCDRCIMSPEQCHFHLGQERLDHGRPMRLQRRHLRPQPDRDQRFVPRHRGPQLRRVGP